MVFSGTGARSRRFGARLATIVAAGVVAVQVGGMSPASANAANPNPDISGTGTVNADGTVSARLSGTWSWPGQKCEGRYGEGYAVDWWGVSSSATPNPSFALTNATQVTSPTATTTGTASPVGAIPISGGGYFHVGQYFAGQVINSAATCTNVGSGSTGAWSASATYPSMAVIPPQVCVNMYDEHGKIGQPSTKVKEYSPLQNGDNSIETNDFNPSVGGGYCVHLDVTAPLSLRVVKTNDANTDGTFSQSEVASSPGNTVAFRAVVRNTSSVAVVIDSLTDEWPGRASFSLDAACPGVVGSTLAAGGSATCSFSQSQYAPAAGQSLTNTVIAQAHQSGIPANTTTDRSTSTVTTNAPPPSGYVEICAQQSGTGLEGVLFSYSMLGHTYRAPIGGCTSAISVPSGRVTITQNFRSSSRLVGIETIPTNRLVSADLPSRTTVVTVVPGNVASQTIVIFTNRLVPGTGYLKICKVAGSGIIEGTKFSFTAGPKTVLVPAGPAPGGYCVVVGTFPFGNQLVTEAAVAGNRISAISVAPSSRSVSRNITTGESIVAIGSGVTEVLYTNVRNP